MFRLLITKSRKSVSKYPTLLYGLELNLLPKLTDFTSFRREISEEEAKEKAAFLGAKYSG